MYKNKLNVPDTVVPKSSKKYLILRSTYSYSYTRLSTKKLEKQLTKNLKSMKTKISHYHLADKILLYISELKICRVNQFTCKPISGHSSSVSESD